MSEFSLSHRKPGTVPKLMAGVEAEGKRKGLDTLFVHGLVNVGIVQAAIQRLTGTSEQFEQVYFGAGGCSEYSLSTIVTICEQDLGVIVTLETDRFSVADLKVLEDNANMELMIPVLKLPLYGASLANIEIAAEKESVRERIQIKFDTGGKSFVAPLSAFVSNDRGDIEADILIWS